MSLMRSLHADLAARATLEPDRPALIDARDETEISYGELWRQVGHIAGWLASEGLAADDNLLALLPNAPATLSLFLATAAYGYGYAPLACESTVHEVLRWAAMVKPKLVLVSDTVDREVAEALQQAGYRVLPQFDCAAIVARTLSPPPAARGRLLLGTSGSTGRPKVMLLDTDRLWSSGYAFSGLYPFVDADARFYNLLPMSYLGGLFNLGLIPLCRGASVVIGEGFSGKTFFDFWQTVERFDINVLWLVPTIARGLLQFAERTGRVESSLLPALRGCFLGTAPIDLATKQRFETVFHVAVYENYGLSETTFISAETPDNRTRRVEGSVGEFVPWAQVVLHPLPAAEVEGNTPNPAEIHLLSPFLALGYLDPDSGALAGIDADQHFATGDLGELTADGLLRLVGRQRDIVKKGGILIALREIEILAETHGDVAEACAVPISHEFYGEDYWLCLRAKTDTGLDADGFGAWLRTRLARHKWPRQISLEADFPRTASGKVQKHLLAAQLKQREGV